jgi:hypothetical protein
MTNQRMMRNAETESTIKRAWIERLAHAQTRGQSLFPGPMCAFRGWRVDNGELQIEFGMTDYREFVGTNVANSWIGERYGEEYLSNGTGVCSVLVTSDNSIVLQRRSQRVFEHPGMLHFCGGSLNPIDKQDSAGADPFAVMMVELDEELAIPETAIVDMSCLGIARDSQTLKPDILLLTRVSLAAGEILEAVSDEHTDLIAISNEPAALHQWIGDHWNEIAPAGLACLTAHIACAFAAGMAASWQS